MKRDYYADLGISRTATPDEISRAYAQLLTFLTEVEMIATDVPAEWMGKLNNNFTEVKNFMATQVMDEARHAEVFRKRALTTGYGLMKASPQNEISLKQIRDADSFACHDSPVSTILAREELAYTHQAAAGCSRIMIWLRNSAALVRPSSADISESSCSIEST